MYFVKDFVEVINKYKWGDCGGSPTGHSVYYRLSTDDPFTFTHVAIYLQTPNSGYVYDDPATYAIVFNKTNEIHSSEIIPVSDPLKLDDVIELFGHFNKSMT